MCLVAALAVTACAVDARLPTRADPPVPSSQAMVPLAASAPVAAEPEVVDASPSNERRVILRTSRIGWHLFSTVETIDGTWNSEVDAPGPGTQTVSVLGREMAGCSVWEDGIACPEVGLVRHRSTKRGTGIDERVVLLRRDGVTWADSPCDAMHLVTPGEREATCGNALRTLGAAPPAGHAPRGGICRWSYRLARRDAPRDAVVRVRMSADAGEVESWAGATPDESLVEHGRYRTWLAREAGWTVAVRIDRRVCGDAEGERFARELVGLAPG